MKQRRNTNRIQTKLFHEAEPSSDPTPLDLAADREAEIKAIIADLLVRVALDNAEVSKGTEYDEQTHA